MYLLAGEIAVHLLYGFGPLVGQDTLKKNKKHLTNQSSTRSNIKHKINILWTY